MAKRKPRKREYVPPSHEILNKKETVVRSTPKRSPERPRRGSAAWTPPVPSLRRTLKRMPIYFVLLFGIELYVLHTGPRKLTWGEEIAQSVAIAVLMSVIFVPLMYMMDRWSYGIHMRRRAKAERADQR